MNFKSFFLKITSFYSTFLFLQVTTTKAPEDVRKIGRGDCSATNGEPTRTTLGELERSAATQGSGRIRAPSNAESRRKGLHGGNYIAGVIFPFLECNLLMDKAHSYCGK